MSIVDKLMSAFKKDDASLFNPDAISGLESQQADVKSKTSKRMGSNKVANVDVYSDLSSVNYPKAGTKLSESTSEVTADGYRSFSENAGKTVTKDSPADKAGKKTWGEFNVSGMDKSVGDYSYSAWQEEGDDGKSKYLFSGEDQDGKPFENELSEDTYNLWSTNLDERAERLADTTSTDTSSVENIKKLTRGKAEVSVGAATGSYYPDLSKRLKNS